MFEDVFRYRLTRVTFFAISFIFIISLLGSIVTLWQRGGVVTQEEQKLAKLQQKNEALKRQYEETQRPSFIEGLAREKLNMSKVGEVVVMLPAITPMLSPTPTLTLPIWQQWRKVLRFEPSS